MPSGLRINRLNAGGVTRVELTGKITEEADFTEAGAQAPGRMVFDLGGIKAINSCGVREWVRFVHGLPRATEAFYERCPSAIAAQANMIADFLGRGRVVSVLAPYYCEKCSDAVEVLLDVRKDLTGVRGAPVRPCPTCGTRLAFDDVEGFFDFLKAQETKG